MNSDRIALIIERDPDGENYLTLAIAGMRED